MNIRRRWRLVRELENLLSRLAALFGRTSVGMTRNREAISADSRGPFDGFRGG